MKDLNARVDALEHIACDLVLVVSAIASALAAIARSTDPASREACEQLELAAKELKSKVG